MAGAAAKKGAPVDLAIVFGGKPGGSSKRAPMHKEPDADEAEGPSDMDADDEMDGAFSVAADEFLDDSLDPEARKAALKRAIEACMGGEY